MKRILYKYKSDIENLEKITGKTIYKSILNEKDKINFLSKISEIKTGRYLAKIFSYNIEYEPNIDKKKPDWVVETNGEKIIFEVLKINLPNEKLLKKIALYEDENLTIPNSGVFISLASLSKNDKSKIEYKVKNYRELIEKKGYKLIIGIDASDWCKLPLKPNCLKV